MENRSYEDLKKWDFKLQSKTINGEIYENLFNEMFTGDITAEVKTELKWNWGKTSNIYIEVSQFRNGKWEDSGLSSTTSDYWIHVLKGEEQEQLHAGLVFETNTLKKRLRYLYDLGLSKITIKEKTDDGHSTKGIIVDPRLLLFTDNEITEFRNKVEQIKKDRIKKIFEKNVN